MQSSPSTIAPLLLRNLLTSIFIHADKLLLSLSQNYRLLQLLRRLLASTFLFFLSLLPSLFSSFTPSEPLIYPSKPSNDDNYSAPINGRGHSGVSRALSQLLLIMNDIPVSSRKYEVVRSLAEKLIDENLLESTNPSLMREVNCAVLSAAFARSLSQLEEAVAEQGRRSGGDDVAGGAAAPESDSNYVYSRAMRRLVKGIMCFGREAWRLARPRSEVGRSAEKLAAELLWLAQKMAASFCADEAVCRWASASKLARLALVAEPRLQGSLVKVSAFLIKQAKEMGKHEEGEGEEEEDGRTDPPLAWEVRQTKMKILMSWLPLLCCANNGTDAPILSMGERAELETILDEIISTLGEEEEQERVLSLWLHHFTYCPASDWPNLRSSYTRWYSASRARLVLDTSASSTN